MDKYLILKKKNDKCVNNREELTEEELFLTPSWIVI